MGLQVSLQGMRNPDSDEREDEDEKCPHLKGFLHNFNGVGQNQKDHSNGPGLNKGLSKRDGEAIRM